MESNQRERDHYYGKGFHDGYIKGQEQGLKIATNALSMSTRPILIQCESEEMAKTIMENLKK